MFTCPECGYQGSHCDFYHHEPTQKGNSGVWCPQCELSLVFTSNGVEEYVNMDDVRKVLHFLRNTGVC